ncbi:DegT/DnrJ/EryC1/StrS family aminotransferase [Natronosalvus halobius]|uniref:DegT/DnrJ/EryC1/StrS family aminotransferase n=1 Tax=Natronosalvus halobius TaxID=2953746 RepID=UPI0020A132D7|nr:DegT/DnrJ/EryC1/StrS family aminotransferase [Natronosalvus halobius]USZ71843.1 DegT/DnrJ/EryC1/StrS family aminotransferase [Natronosalvus halobius]
MIGGKPSVLASIRNGGRPLLEQAFVASTRFRAPDTLADDTPPASRTNRPTVASYLEGRADEMAYYGSSKAALRDGLATLLAMDEGGATNVLLPAYLPDAVVEPIRELDIEPRRYAITESLAPNRGDLESRIVDRTLAVISVNYFGFPQPGFDVIEALVDEYDCYHVEDNAHGPLTLERGRLLGTRGDVGVTSLWKLLAIPNGAVLYLSNPDVSAQFEPSTLAGVNSRVRRSDLAFVCKSLATGAFARRSSLEDAATRFLATNRGAEGIPDPNRRYEASKTRLSRLSAAVIAGSDPDEIRSRRRENYRAWTALFANRPDVDPLFETLPPGVCPQVFPVQTDRPERLRRLLESHGVGGVHTWPRLSRSVLENPAFETARHLSETVVLLPVHQHVDPDAIRAVERAIDRRLEPRDESSILASRRATTEVLATRLRRLL